MFFFFSSRRRHTRYWRDWSSDVCSSDLYNALFFGRPVTTKYLQVFGPDLPLKLYETPLGASATELVSLAGVDVDAEAGKLSVIDGGPYLTAMGIEALGEGDAFVRRTTNGFLVIPKGVASKEYADIKTKRPGEGIVSLVGEVSGVKDRKSVV